MRVTTRRHRHARHRPNHQRQRQPLKRRLEGLPHPADWTERTPYECSRSEVLGTADGEAVGAAPLVNMGMLLPTALPEADRAVLVARVNRATSTQRDALRALIILTLDGHGCGRPPGWWAARPARWSNGGTAIGSACWRACVICLVRVRRGSTAMSSAVGSPPRPPASRPRRGGRGPTPDWPSTSTPRRSRAAGSR